MKAILSLVSLCLAALLLSGCNNDSDSVSAAASAPTPDSFTLQVEAIVQASETSDAVSVDSVALTQSETTDAVPIAVP